MKSLNEDLKTGQFKQIYLLYGEEGYLKRQYRDRFIKAMLPDGDTMNYAHYEGKNINVREVIDLAERLARTVSPAFAHITEVSDIVLTVKELMGRA